MADVHCLVGSRCGDLSPVQFGSRGSKCLGVFRGDGATWRLKTLSPLPRLGPGQGSWTACLHGIVHLQDAEGGVKNKAKQVNGYG